MEEKDARVREIAAMTKQLKEVGERMEQDLRTKDERI
jgi:uncharacterized protein YwgA